MQNPFRAYSIKVTILTISLALGGMITFNSILNQPPISSFPFIIVLFYATSLLVFYLLERLTNSNPKRFIQMYTLFSGMKLIFYSLSLVILFFAWRHDAIKIALCFGICYVCYTGLEIVSVLKNLK